VLARVVSAIALSLAAGSSVGGGFVAGLIATVFDPAWNIAHGRVIWTVIVLVLFLSGLGLPLPEDVPLTLAGFTMFKQSGEAIVPAHFALTFLTVVVPILLGDMIAYGMGRKYGIGLRDRFAVLRRALPDARLTRVRHWFASYGAFTVFLGRQVAGVRFVTFFSAGSMHVPFARFVFFDFLGCLVSVPVWLTLGVLASRYGEQWLQIAMRRVGSGFMLAALVLFGVLLLVARLRRRKLAAAAARRVAQTPQTTAVGASEKID